MRKRPPQGLTIPELRKGKLHSVHAHGTVDSSAN